MIKETLQIEGMTCVNCAKSVTKYLEKNGNENVFVDFIGKEAVFDFNEKSDLSEVIVGIEQLGFKVKNKQPTNNKNNTHNNLFSFNFLKHLKTKLIICAIFTLPLLLPMFVKSTLLTNPFLQLALCIPVFIIGMYHFGKSAFYGLRSGILNMDVLITIGTLSAFVYSLYGTINNLGINFQFYETSATIITLVLFGNFLEEKAINKTTSAVNSLYKMQPKTLSKVVNFKKEDEKLVSINTEDAKVDDLFFINAGDRIPLDATIVDGSGTLDEASLSGESFPVEKNENDKIYSGTLLIQGNITAKIIATKNESVFSKIISMVKKAQQDKPEMQKLADKISNIFVPSVLVLAIFSFFLNFYFLQNSTQQSILNSIAVLVISCPCALGLATPTAVVVGLGKAAKNGILVKGASFLQKFANVKKVVFDKTGTLTTGNFKIKKINALNISENKLKEIIKGLEKYSNHPIAKSVYVALQNSKEEKFVDVKELSGLGVMAKNAAGDVFSLGSYNLAKHLTKEDFHSFYVIKNDALIGTIDLYDFEKENAAKMVNYFNTQNIETVLLSGDKKIRCEEMAKKLNIKKVFAETLPEEKLQYIEDWQKKQNIAMLGDGINDAPALTKANVGISFAKGTNIAMQASEMVLMKDDLENIVKAHKIAIATFKTVKQNLFWAFAYNIIAIPLAMFGFLNPMVAAFSMAFSDLIVVGNSLRFLLKKEF